MAKTEKGKTADPKPTQQSNKRKNAAGKTDGSQKRPKKEGITAIKSSTAPKAEKYATFASLAVLGSPLYASSSPLMLSAVSRMWLAHRTDVATLSPQKERKRNRKEGTEVWRSRLLHCYHPRQTVVVHDMARILLSVQKAIKKWEAIRRHDTNPKERAALVSEVLKEVSHPLKLVSSSCARCLCYSQHPELFNYTCSSFQSGVVRLEGSL